MRKKSVYKTIIGACTLAAGCLFTLPALATNWAPPVDCQVDPFDTTDADKQNIAIAYCALADIPHKVDGNIWGKYRLMRHAGKAFENPGQLCEAYTVTRWKRDYDKEPRIDRMTEIAADEQIMSWWDVEKIAHPEAVEIVSELESNVCGPDVVRVFVSSTKFTGGGFGGLAGADAQCQSLADSSGVNGTFVAWMSDSTADAKDRITQNSGAYVLLDGTLIADSFADLIDGSLYNPIDITENSTSLSDQADWAAQVWTGSESDGSLAATGNFSTSTCFDWTSNTTYTLNNPVGGIIGSTYSDATGWSTNYAGKCNFERHFYCFEK